MQLHKTQTVQTSYTLFVSGLSFVKLMSKQDDNIFSIAMLFALQDLITANFKQLHCQQEL